jgi:hypothetical protein
LFSGRELLENWTNLGPHTLCWSDERALLDRKADPRI